MANSGDTTDPFLRPREGYLEWVLFSQILKKKELTLYTYICMVDLIKRKNLLKRGIMGCAVLVYS